MFAGDKGQRNTWTHTTPTEDMETTCSTLSGLTEPATTEPTTTSQSPRHAASLLSCDDRQKINLRALLRTRREIKDTLAISTFPNAVALLKMALNISNERIHLQIAAIRLHNIYAKS